MEPRIALAVAWLWAPGTGADHAVDYGGRAGPTFKLTDCGAVGDNATLNTAAFEAAVAAVETVRHRILGLSTG